MAVFPWRIGILGQALAPLAVGTVLVVAITTAIFWTTGTAQVRAEAIRLIARQTDDRSWREQALFNRVANQVEQCRRVMRARYGAEPTSAASIPLMADGSRRQMPSASTAPLAVFVTASAASDPAHVRAAAIARDLLAELGPAWATHPDNLTIAAPGAWLAGWGTEAIDLVDAMLPNDPVLLPAEREVVDGSLGIRWSRAYLEPTSGQWRIAATASARLPGIGLIAITQMVPVDDVLARATSHTGSGLDTVVYDADRRVLASTWHRPSAAGSATNSIMATILAVDRGGPISAVLRIAEPAGWIGFSRFSGPGWTMATFHPRLAIEAQARDATLHVVAIGMALLVAQAALLLVVLRLRVARPLQALGHAASILEQGRTEPVFELARHDEVGDLARSFKRMADAIRRREAELRTAMTALREREQHATALVASAADAVLIITDGLITEANPQAHALFNATSEDLVAHSPGELSPPLQPDGEASLAKSQRLLSAAAAGAVCHFAWQHRRPDGQEFAAEVGLARIEIPGHHRLVAVVRDVSARNRLEEQLRQAQKMDSLGQLAGGIAHDFNNMLTGIMGAAELLRQTPSHEATRHDRLITTIMTASERAAGLTRKLLAFARKSHSLAVPVDLHQILHDTADLLATALDKRIRIELDLQAPLSTVLGDAAQLQNALMNLGLNARDAMPEGGVLMFSTSVHQCPESVADQPTHLKPGAYLRLTVSDSGAGIPKNLLERIFEPFFTTKPQGKGTGLGLAAVWGTVQEHHGTINVTSEPGRGTVFTVFLPCSNAVVLPPQQQAVIGSRIGRGTVLVIDDEDVVRECTRLQLEHLGWTVLEARDGREGLDVFRREQRSITLVLVDMEMPRMRGIDCLRELRQLDPQVRAILCTGYARDATAAQLQAEGFRTQLLKPYNQEDLAKVLDDVIGRT